MFSIVITSSETWIHKDNEVDKSNKIMGFLLHQEGIKEIIESMKINKYYVETTKGNLEEITKTQAFMLYDMILEYNKNKSKTKK